MIPSLEPEVSGDALTTCADVDDMLPWPSSAVSRRLPQVQVGKRRKPRGENPDPSCAPRKPDERGHLAPARLTPPAHPATGDDHAWLRFIGRSLTAAKTARTPTGVDTMKHASLLGIALVLAAGYALAQDGMTEAQVRAKLEIQGYTKVNDVKFEDGVWKADARSGAGNRVDVRIDPETGVVRPARLVANLSEPAAAPQPPVAGYPYRHGDAAETVKRTDETA